LCLAAGSRIGEDSAGRSEIGYANMRAALDSVMTKVPVDQATPGIKAHMTELILKAAADGQTTRRLVAAASDQIQAIIPMLT
jgi:hypothetical protein